MEKNLDVVTEEVVKEKEVSSEYCLDNIVEYTDLLVKYSSLENDYNILEEEVKALRIFKLEQEKIQKTLMIEQFYCLSDELKQDVVDKIDEYTLDEIEKELSVICFRNNINFNLENNINSEEEEEKEEGAPITYTLDVPEPIPAWIKALQDNKNNN